MININIIVGDILAKDFDCNFREVAAADQVNEVRPICQPSSVLTLHHYRLPRPSTTSAATCTWPEGKTKPLCWTEFWAAK